MRRALLPLTVATGIAAGTATPAGTQNNQNNQDTRHGTEQISGSSIDLPGIIANPLPGRPPTGRSAPRPRH